MSAAAVSLPDVPKGQTTKCLQAFRGLFSISQKHPEQLTVAALLKCPTEQSI